MELFYRMLEHYASEYLKKFGLDNDSNRYYVINKYKEYLPTVAKEIVTERVMQEYTSQENKDKAIYYLAEQLAKVEIVYGEQAKEKADTLIYKGAGLWLYETLESNYNAHTCRTIAYLLIRKTREYFE